MSRRSSNVLRAAAVFVFALVLAAPSCTTVIKAAARARDGPEGPPRGGTFDVVQFIYGSYAEGVASYLDVVPGPKHLRHRRLIDRWGCPSDRDCYHVDYWLKPGRHTITSHQRPCDDHCSHLDPPTDRCSADFFILDGDYFYARIDVRPGGGCSISFLRG